MMMKKPSNAMLLFSFMFLFLVDINGFITEAPTPQPQPNSKHPTYGTTQGSLHPQECGGRCSSRCSNTQYKKPCLFFCQKCCATCLCVPSGTYGNKETCPCYNNWKTKRGGPKCP
ncbi:gibberellin-regulated protein 6 [Mercurialis annua]|uniref:gibberellin-regulated protein 6 n=1 Tax=Mercurialis annua TaxID=3986 RepID=UPI00215E287B|nr:gibberellin-regulated protein 6 [Mercurialis annua]